MSRDIPGPVLTDSRSRALIVGLTGGVASGKSAVAAELRSLGVRVIDTDELARRAVEPGTRALAEIREMFGDDIIDRYGGLDRRAMRSLVFGNADARRQLEGIVHPRIAELLEREVASVKESVCVVVIPLLVEAGWIDRVDRVVVVDVPHATQLARLMARDSLDEAAALDMIAAQAGREERLAVAHDVLDNSGDADGLRALARPLVKALEAIARHRA